MGDVLTILGGAVFVSVVFIKFRDALRDNTAAIMIMSETLLIHGRKLDEHHEILTELRIRVGYRDAS